jgi:hypothetical protein
MPFQLTFNIPDDKKDLFVDAWADGYPQGAEPPTQQEKQQFAKQQIKDVLVNRVRTYEGQKITPIDIT